jgi:hypothetical protein
MDSDGVFSMDEDCQMNEVAWGIEIKIMDNKGNGIFATRDFVAGDVIFAENPLVSCQFPWNTSCGYKACDYCLRPLETAEENVRRLLGRHDLVLPHPECCVIDKASHVQCENCMVEYCSLHCKDKALAQYHQIMCLATRDGKSDHPLEHLNETWKQMNYPPETSSILLFARILAMINQSKDKNAVLHQFSHFCHHTVTGDAQISHKLLGHNFKNQLEILREMLSSIFDSPETHHWLTPDGFYSLVAMVGTNGQGVGSSPLAEWSKRAGQLDNIPEEEKVELDAFIDKLYDDLEEETGGFLNCEGSALYSLQSKCNHSCEPNAEICFLHANTFLTLRATCAIAKGEEVCISYLSSCDLTRSRHSRQKLLRENYVFECHCPRCERELGDPDITSDESSLGEEEEEEAD